MIKTAIILAGGLGTRLRSAVADLPKCMAPVAGIPFISFVITYLKKEGIEHFIFSLGYKSEAVISYVNASYKGLQATYVVETKQLGTGGAIKEACKKVKESNVVVVNGDTLFTAGIRELADFHEKQLAGCTIALKEMKNFDRYGAVEVTGDHTIKAFREKKFYAAGIINGGVYALSAKLLNEPAYPEVFSFEKEYLEKNTTGKKLYGIVSDAYFIDIGIPEDYLQFQDDFRAIIKNSGNSEADTVNTFLNELNT